MTRIVGYVASVIASFSLLPQVVKVIQTKSAADLSYGMIFMIMTASTLWHIHGWIINDIPLRLSSAATILVNVTLLTLKVTLDRKNKDAQGLKDILRT